MKQSSLRFAAAVVLVSLLLAACAGRTAHPIKSVYPDDATLSCTDIQTERRKNNGEIVRLTAEKARRIRHNVNSLLTFFCIIPLFELNFSNADGIEIEAYKERNRRLGDLAKQLNCNLPAR